jgi:hypothetical protein
LVKNGDLCRARGIFFHTADQLLIRKTYPRIRVTVAPGGPAAPVQAGKNTVY